MHTPGFVWPYQSNDVLIYFAGLLKRTRSNVAADASSNFIKRSNCFMAKFHGVGEWIRDRKEWTNHQQLPVGHNGRNHCIPARMIYCFGLKQDTSSQTEEKQLLALFEKRLEDYLLGEVLSHRFHFNSLIPDGSGRRGKMIFRINDSPLTPHQKERTKCNRHPITTETEQRRLLGTRAGFAGLFTGSVGMEVF